MSLTKSIVKNTAFIFFSEVFSKIISFFLTILIAKYLGDVGLGKYSFVFAFVYIFSIFSDLGMSNLVIREVAKNHAQAKKYFTSLFSFKLVSMTIIGIVTCVSIFFTESNWEIRFTVFLAAGVLFFETFCALFTTLFRAFERMHYVAFINIIERLIAFLIGIFVLIIGENLLLFIIVLLFSQMISSFIGMFITAKYFFPVRFEWDWVFIKKMIKSSIPFWFVTLFVVISFKIDTVILTFMSTFEAVGWYSAANKLVEALSFVPQMVIYVTYPVMSRLHESSNHILQELYRKSMRYLMTLIIPICVGCTLFADKIISTLYQDAFMNAVLPLRILIWAELFIFANFLMGYLLNAISREKLFTLVTGITFFVNIVLNLLFIPFYNYIGAAIAVLVTQIVNFLLLLYFTTQNNFVFSIKTFILKQFFAAVIMAVVLFFMKNFSILFLIPVGATIYFGILFMLKGITKEDLSLLKVLLPKK